MRTRANTRRMVWVSVVAGVLVLLFANAHLVYLAFSTEPGCVPHAKEIDMTRSGGSFRAAKSAC